MSLAENTPSEKLDSPNDEPRATQRVTVRQFDKAFDDIAVFLFERYREHKMEKVELASPTTEVDNER